jgi:hypothetical protein
MNRMHGDPGVEAYPTDFGFWPDDPELYLVQADWRIWSRLHDDACDCEALCECDEATVGSLGERERG